MIHKPHKIYVPLILLLGLQLQKATCGISAASPKGPLSDVHEDNGKELEGTIQYPFFDHDYKWPIQSPVDIVTSKIEEKSNLPTLKIVEPQLPNVEVDVYNSGSTVVVFSDKHNRDKLPYLEGGPLQEKFVLEQTHFHWGRHDEWGSEHMIDGEAFSVEIHMVHFNGKYKDFRSSLSERDGLAVLTIFAEVDNLDDPNVSKDNPLLDPLSKILNDIKTPNVHKTLPWKEAMQWAISGMKVNTEYYTYPGSLTTPKYNQNVAFILLPEPISISHKQLKAFRTLNHNNTKNPIVENKRNIQPLNRRPIYRGRINVENDQASNSAVRVMLSIGINNIVHELYFWHITCMYYIYW